MENAAETRRELISVGFPQKSARIFVMRPQITTEQNFDIYWNGRLIS